MSATAVAPAPADATTAPPSRRAAWWRRPAAACALLLVVYACCSLANDPRAFLTTDEGGKVATLKAMDARGDLKPDLGFWAQAFDPKGVLHPIALTDHLRGEWVNVTTLPMLYAGFPLYELGGLRAILLLPMLGGVLTALAARALARRLGGQGDLAFWLVGLVTPVIVYSLDYWEHSLGLAAMAWGVVWLLDVAERRVGWRGALAGGALFGIAATMRTEALIYAFVTVLVVGWARRRGSRRDLARCGVAALVGVALPLVANTGLEVLAVGGPLRVARTSSAASSGGGGLASRASDAMRITVGLNGFAPAFDWLLGTLIALALAVAAYRLLSPDRDRRRVGWLALALAGCCYLLRLDVGLSFLSGLLVSSPLAVVGLVVANRRPEFKRPVAIALLALPLVWVFEYTGGAAVEWGGRYVLLTGLLLVVVAAVALERAPWRGVVAMVATAAAVTGIGLAWLAVRSHDYAQTIGGIAAAPGPIVTTSTALQHLWREGGAFYTPTRPWLTAPTPRDLAQASRLLERVGATSFLLVSRTPQQAPTRLGPYVREAGHSIAFVEVIRLQVTRYSR